MLTLIVAWIVAVISAYYFLKSAWLGYKKMPGAANEHEMMALRWAILSVLLNILGKMP